MIKTVSRTQDTILVVDETGVKTARADHPNWAKIGELFNMLDSKDGVICGPTDQLLALMDMKTGMETYTVGMLSVSAGGVVYNGRPLHTIDAERVMAFWRDGLSYKPIANYIARKMKNPSARAIQEMYNFLEHRGMPLTIRGTFLAYKGVDNNFWSICGNKDTVVLQGRVNGDGHILNEPGMTIEVERSSVDDDYRRGCSYGLHAGSLSYARNWGKRVVIVEIDPADVVSVPEDCNCQKLRCCKYTVIGEYTGPLPDTLCTDYDEEDEGVCHQCGGEEGECDCELEETETEGDTEPAERECEDCQRGDCEGCGAENEQHLNREDHAAPKQTAQSEIYKKVVAILSEMTGVSQTQIGPDTIMDSGLLSMDSLDGVEFTMALEEAFGFEIPDEDAEKHSRSTVAEIVNSIEAHQSKLNSPVNPSVSQYEQGQIDGQNDYSNGLKAKWMKFDDEGADSESHAEYIRGYVLGFNQ